MTKRASSMIAALAGATMLLVACGQTQPTAQSGQGSGSAVAPTSSPASSVESTTNNVRPTTAATTPPTRESGVEPVNCGPVKVNTSTTHSLIADPALNGRVGCTEAFTVFDEFAKLPQARKSEASLGNVKLSGDWSCTVDDGKTASVMCVKGKVEDKYELSFHTKPLSA